MSVDAMNVWEMSWPCGILEVQSLGGMLAPVTFRLGSGRSIRPLHEAPWTGEVGASELPPILQRLRGEWPCVPFGAARPVSQLAADWQDIHWDEPEGPPHGYGANAHWQLVERTESGITLEIAYPEAHPIRRLRRCIRPRAGEPALDLELQIETRADVRLPIGLHPTFRLSARARRTQLHPAPFQFGVTFPGDFEPGADDLARGATFGSLQAVPTASGDEMDLSRLPLDRKTEHLLELCGIEGVFELYNEEEDYHVRLQWDPTHFPSCVLWISNGGRADFPWNGRHVALGVEPVSSAFDLGTHVSTAMNPIQHRAIATAVEFEGDSTWETAYSLQVY